MDTNVDTCGSKDELFSSLASLDIIVPLLSESRTKHHIERWAVCRLLASLGASNNLSFPISLLHREKPDFCLSTGVGKIGLEITEALQTNYAEARKLAERKYSTTILESGHFRRGKVPVGKMKELFEYGKLNSPPWMGNSMEREWAQDIALVIEGKLKKLASPGFT
jgi:hypothetical protein